MRFKTVFILLLSGCVFGAGQLTAEESQPPGSTTVSDTSTAQADTAGVSQAGMADVIVVTASRTEQKLSDVPSAMTVLDAEKIETLPADNYGDLLRLAPGINSGEFSAGDHSIVARQATRVISSGQLAMIDNRAVYQNFNGQVWWNGLPLDPNEIKQIEVLRGPNSAVWGANAMGGVVNIITKSPRDMPGTTFMLGGGERETMYGRLTHAGTTGKFAYKVTGSWFEQDAYDRPTGSIPGTEGPSNPDGTPYPPYDSEGTEQPKINARVDFSADEKTTWSLSGGYGGMRGLILTPSGPGTHDAGSYQAYAKADWVRHNTKISAYASFLKSAGEFLLSGVSGTLETQTYHLDLSDTRVAGENHLLT